MKLKRRLISLLCAALLAAAMTACAPIAIADGGPYYPVSVEEAPWGEGMMRVTRVYQLALTDSARLIPTEDFERDGYRYHFLDMTKENMVGADTREHTETVTKDCKSNDVSEALKLLDAEKSVTTPDGYSGKLLLDHESVKVSVKGYKTSSKNVSATRVYADLADADLELIPKTITENENLLTLNDAQWESVTDDEGNLRFTATAQYTGTATSRVATGYVVTANYTGHVVKMNCEMITYRVTFTGTEIPKEPESEPEPEPAPEPETEPETMATVTEPEAAESEAETVTETEDEAVTEGETETPFPPLRDVLSILGCVGGVATLGGVTLCVVEVRLKRKGDRETTNET